MQQDVKQILKKIFPLVLLRNIQLGVNKLRIKTIDKLRFPEQLIATEDFAIQRNDYPFRLYPVKQVDLDERLQRQIADNQSWTQDEYLLDYKKTCIIEPRFGWALSEQKQLVYPSLGFSRVPYLQKPDAKIKKLWNTPLEEYEELISLRDTGEENYYHFYNDIISKLFFLEKELNLGNTIPILIAKKLYDKPYFQYFLQHPYLHSRRWVVQDQQYIRSKRTYFCKPLTHTPSYYQRVLRMVNLLEGPIKNSDRSIFITRSPQRLRHIENIEEIERTCKDLGFEIIDFDLMTVSEQIRTMMQARYIVGIHGAGLVNMLFRGTKALSLLEIYPPANYFPFHYILMANQLNYAYDGIIGYVGKEKYSGSFYVNPVELRNRVQKLLQS